MQLASDSTKWAYYATLVSGLCNAYLAARVMSSDLVSTRTSGATVLVSHAVDVRNFGRARRRPRAGNTWARRTSKESWVYE